MSLGIFSFDLAALINRLSNLVEVSKNEPVAVASESALAKIEEALTGVVESESKMDDVLMAAALTNTVTAVISKETVKTAAPKTAVRSMTLDDETRREFERLIKSLQTSVIHNYRDADLLNEHVSAKNVKEFAKNENPREAEKRGERQSEERKNEARKLDKMHEDLRLARLKNNLEG